MANTFLLFKATVNFQITHYPSHGKYIYVLVVYFELFCDTPSHPPVEGPQSMWVNAYAFLLLPGAGSAHSGAAALASSFLDCAHLW